MACRLRCTVLASKMVLFFQEKIKLPDRKQHYVSENNSKSKFGQFSIEILVITESGKLFATQGVLRTIAEVAGIPRQPLFDMTSVKVEFRTFRFKSEQVIR